MKKFYFCDHTGSGRCCIFTEQTMEGLWKRTGGDIARCPRHGQLICTGKVFATKEDARRWLDKTTHD